VAEGPKPQKALVVCWRRRP